MLLFRSDIASDETLENSDQLRSAVDQVIESVILALPEADLLTNTGFHETSSTGFILDFTSVDSLSGSPIRHRLKTVIYRLNDDSQVMFTLWARSAAEVWPEVAEPISLMQSGFSYDGEYALDVFAATSDDTWKYLLVLGAMLVSLVLLRKRRISKAEQQSA